MHTEDTVVIPLTQGKVAVIDAIDAERVLRHHWNVMQTYPGKWYVRGRVNGKNIYLHRFILDAADGEHIDHIDGDGLRNTRANLRFATRSQNLANQKTRSCSGYRGVYPTNYPWGPETGWQARITINGKDVRLGIFADRIAAAHAYDKVARVAFGEFATLNFPEHATSLDS